MTRPRPYSLPFWFELLAIFVVGLLVRVAFIHLHPAIYGGDTLVRIMNPDRVLLAYQLPLLQLLIYLINQVSSDPLLIRYLMSLIGALAGVAFFLLSATLVDRSTARFASLFFVFNPFLLVHSIVPYQEILMLLFLCLGLYCLLRPTSIPPGTRGDFRGVGEEAETPTNLPLAPSLCKEGERRIAWASVFLGLACLTRYEAWVITAAAGLHYARTRSDGRSLRGYLQLLTKTMALFGWAPLLWILLHRGVSPQGTYVLEGPATWERLLRIPYIVAMALHHAGPIVGCLALLGLLTFWKRSLWAKPGVQMVIVAAALLMVSLVFSAHGVEPNPQRYVTDREAHWFVLFAFWAAALGLSWLKEPAVSSAKASHSKAPTHSSNLRTVIHRLVLVLAVVWGIFQTDRYIKRLLADQNLILDYAVAQHLEQNLSDGRGRLGFCSAHPGQFSSAVSRQSLFPRRHSRFGGSSPAARRPQLRSAGLFTYRCKYPRTKRPDRGWKQADREPFRHPELCLTESRAFGSSLLKLPGSGGQHEASVGLFETAKRATRYPEGSRLAGVHLRGAVLNRCQCSSVLSEMKLLTSALNRFSSNGAAVSRMSCG